MIKYRPHRGGLAESMKEEKQFSSIQEMYQYIINEWNNHGVNDILQVDDLSISGDHGKDKRISWKETRYVCTSRIGNEIYNTPQCIGMCSIE